MVVKWKRVGGGRKVVLRWTMILVFYSNDDEKSLMFFQKRMLRSVAGGRCMYAWIYIEETLTLAVLCFETFSN